MRSVARKQAYKHAAPASGWVDEIRKSGRVKICSLAIRAFILLRRMCFGGAFHPATIGNRTKDDELPSLHVLDYAEQILAARVICEYMFEQILRSQTHDQSFRAHHLCLSIHFVHEMGTG